MCASPHTYMHLHLCPSACTCTHTHTKAVTAVFTASQTGIYTSTTHMHKYTELVQANSPGGWTCTPQED